MAITAKNKLSNETRNHGKEKSQRMHWQRAVKIDIDLERERDEAAKLEAKRARNRKAKKLKKIREEQNNAKVS